MDNGSYKIKTTIVLVGLMGAGKTRIGRDIAHLTDIPFMDADHEIEAAAGCSVSDIFENYGEQAFRDGERKVIKRLLSEENIILATGGGAFMDAQTRKAIKESNAVSVWLNADLDLLVERTQHSTHRPLLTQGEPREILGNLIKERYPIYAEADVDVECLNIPPIKMALSVLACIKNFQEKNV